MKLLLPTLLISFVSFIKAQTPVLNFDGVDDYVNLGNTVGNNARTIEFWFSPSINIDSTLTDFVALVTREVSPTNEHEWDIHFIKSGITALPAGKIRFTIHETVGTRYEIFSNSNKWNAGEWYHLAAVIDSIQGMMLFINGVKQNSTLPSYTSSTDVANANTEVGHWGANVRFYTGKIDDVRISKNSVYTSNFTPPCPDITSTSNTKGLWNFNDNSGSFAIDSSGNNNHGIIYGGAMWTTELICSDQVGIKSSIESNKIDVYPNPSNQTFNFIVSDIAPNSYIEVYNIFGMKVLTKKVSSKNFTLNLSNFDTGIYLYRLATDNKFYASGKITKI